MPHGNGPLRRLWHWIKDQVIQDVPKSIAVCEFDCRKGQCTMGEWKTCENRLHKIVKAFVPLDDVDRDEQTKNGSDGP
jgi:hypothetical protein